MKYLGIDYGSKRIGVAVSNDEGTIAFPRPPIANDGQAIARIADIVKEEKVSGLVIGDTRAFSGAPNVVTPDAESFARVLGEKTGVAVETMWEAWSSREASRFAPVRARRTGGPKGVKDDSAAAAIILQRFLDKKRS